MPGRPLPVLPITDIASGTATFDVVAGTPQTAPVPAEAFAKEKAWMRWNDWGIGLLLQGDTRGAEAAFRKLATALPDRVDGWRNLARTALADGKAREALDLLTEADRREPGSPQNAFFLGQALEQLGELDGAVAQFETALSKFREDRSVLHAIGRIRYRQGRWEDAMRSFLAVLAIDPEDRIAHYHRMLLYRVMADEAPDGDAKADLTHAAEQAAKAFRKYSIDESAQKWTNEFRRERPDVNLESQPIHVHRLELRR
jgi:tetratricopeptide (TPR) repeat protein